jgi:uncharacterized membrane protein
MDTTPPVTPITTEAHKNILMAVLAYIGPLVIVSYITAKDDPFVKFHIKQGLVLVVIEVAIWFLRMFFWQLWTIWSIVDLAVLILAIIGIINAAHGKEVGLPVVGDFSSHFPI